MMDLPLMPFEVIERWIDWRLFTVDEIWLMMGLWARTGPPDSPVEMMEWHTGIPWREWP